MSNGWPIARRARRAATLMIVPVLLVAPSGCAQKRQGLLGGAGSPKPSPPPLAAARPEPGLHVRAPFVDVQLADRAAEGIGVDGVKGDGETVKASKEPTAISSRVGLFRSPSSGRSLGEPSPLN